MVRAGWDTFWRDERYFRHPYASPQLVHALVDSRAGIVAIDTLNIDSTADAGYTAHETLLGADVPIAENLCNLGALNLARPYAFAFLPLSLGAADGSPARVVAWDPSDFAG